MEQINERVRLFRLDLQSGPAQVCTNHEIQQAYMGTDMNHRIKFFSGQWLDTFVPGIEKPGGFTIISPPSAAAATENSQEHPYLELAVQESPQNPQASWLWRPIDEILDSSIRVRIGGSFVFPPPLSSADESIQSIRKVVFVAGGVGINPLMSMLSHIAETQAQDVEVQMLHGNKLPAGGVSKILFLDRITRLFGQGRLRGQLRLFITPDGEGNDGLANKSETQSINGANVHLQAGRIGLDNLREAIEEDRETSLAYVCGPPAMTDEFVSVLKSESGLRMHASRVLSEKWW